MEESLFFNIFRNRFILFYIGEKIREINKFKYSYTYDYIPGLDWIISRELWSLFEDKLLKTQPRFTFYFNSLSTILVKYSDSTNPLHVKVCNRILNMYVTQSYLFVLTDSNERHRDIIYLAAGSNNVIILEMITKNYPTMTTEPDTMNWAIENGSLEAVHYLHSNRPSDGYISDYLIQSAVASPKGKEMVDFILYTLEYKKPETVSIFGQHFKKSIRLPYVTIKLLHQRDLFFFKNYDVIDFLNYRHLEITRMPLSDTVDYLQKVLFLKNKFYNPSESSLFLLEQSENLDYTLNELEIINEQDDTNAHWLWRYIKYYLYPSSVIKFIQGERVPAIHWVSNFLYYHAAKLNLNERELKTAQIEFDLKYNKLRYLGIRYTLDDVSMMVGLKAINQQCSIEMLKIFMSWYKHKLHNDKTGIFRFEPNPDVTIDSQLAYIKVLLSYGISFTVTHIYNYLMYSDQHPITSLAKFMKWLKKYELYSSPWYFNTPAFPYTAVKSKFEKFHFIHQHELSRYFDWTSHTVCIALTNSEHVHDIIKFVLKNQSPILNSFLQNANPGDNVLDILIRNTSLPYKTYLFLYNMGYRIIPRAIWAGYNQHLSILRMEDHRIFIHTLDTTEMTWKNQDFTKIHLKIIKTRIDDIKNLRFGDIEKLKLQFQVHQVEWPTID
ncbi:hypothetical protein DLAC_11186 [Tieghemostelium lacteum]|uniref:Uncharacterized protein n=1 Tax=Tieghemostelium lacteum TaxID=361077 RepID=A0A151Z3D2_TIELA|nr:hypothetical protein DLAC_11186 [Tieghemostelium lacteum]|eukprot:KYQ88473.1 hypothetical protein DLAC_11186 [Tieghemostelium lacteum]